MSECIVQVDPAFDTTKYMGDYFSRKGFDTYISLQIIDSKCYVTFPNRLEADEFVEAFDRRRVNGETLRVAIKHLPEDDDIGRSSSKRYQSPSDDERRIRSRTIVVKGYPSSQLTDRNLYNDFWRCGYLKEVEVSNGVGYLQFDTPEDAENAIQKNDQTYIGGSRITVEMVQDRALNMPNILVPLMITDKEE